MKSYNDEIIKDSLCAKNHPVKRVAEPCMLYGVRLKN